MTSIDNTSRTPAERHKSADAITKAKRHIEQALLDVAANGNANIERAARQAREEITLLDDGKGKVEEARKAVDALIDSWADYDASLSGGGTAWGIRAARRMLRDTLRVDKALREL